MKEETKLIGERESLAKIEKIYNDICGSAFVNLFTLSKNNQEIILSPFDIKNEEHLFLLCVAKGLGGVVEKDVCVNVSRRHLRKLNKGLKKEAHYRDVKDCDISKAIDPNEVLTFMRDRAVVASGSKTVFVDIYQAFYKKGKK